MGNTGPPPERRAIVPEIVGRAAASLPRPTVRFRRQAWLAFQRALDPLAQPRPLRLPRGR
ncbi:MAG TPA: hypothetical protein VK874_01005 [Gaiellaceae bacterium]|nr:hypothetical protein [Gaiellaceae bacterium]